MPIYEYHCDNCGENFELIQKFADAPLTSHEKCHGGPVHRLISAPAFQFKGSGWYVTDYAKNSNSPAPNGGSKTSEKNSEKSSEQSSESAAPAATKTDAGSSSSSSDSSSSGSSSSTSGSKSDTK